MSALNTWPGGLRISIPVVIGGMRVSSSAAPCSAAGDRADHVEHLLPLDQRLGKRGVGVVVRMIFLRDEEPDERTPLPAVVVAHRAPERRVRGLEGVEDRALRDGSPDVDRHLSLHLREGAQVGGQDDPDHGRVCTSTDRTAGRSRTIASQLSPLSADAYTWPPLVPKYTPQSSRPSTAIASRRTFR